MTEKVAYTNRYGKTIYVTEKQVAQYQRQSKEFTAKNKARRKKRAKPAKKVAWQTRTGKTIYVTEKQARQYGRQSEQFTRLNMARAEAREAALSKLVPMGKGVYANPETGVEVLAKDITKAIWKDSQVLTQKEAATNREEWDNFVDEIEEVIQGQIGNLSTKNAKSMVRKNLKELMGYFDRMSDAARQKGGSVLRQNKVLEESIQKEVIEIVYDSDTEVAEYININIKPILDLLEEVNETDITDLMQKIDTIIKKKGTEDA